MPPHPSAIFGAMLGCNPDIVAAPGAQPFVPTLNLLKIGDPAHMGGKPRQQYGTVQRRRDDAD